MTSTLSQSNPRPAEPQACHAVAIRAEDSLSRSQLEGNDGQPFETKWWAGTGLNRRHQDFQSRIRSCSRVSAGSEDHSFRYFSNGRIPRGTASYPRKHGQSHGQSSASHDALPTPTPSRPRYKFLGHWAVRRVTGTGLSVLGSQSRAHIQKDSIFPAIGDGCPVASTVITAIGQFERALVGDRIRSGLEREVRG